MYYENENKESCFGHFFVGDCWHWLVSVSSVVKMMTKEENSPFDPSKPVVISDFTPKEGGLGSRLVLYGDNFGNDVSKVKVDDWWTNSKRDWNQKS